MLHLHYIFFIFLCKIIIFLNDSWFLNFFVDKTIFLQYIMRKYNQCFVFYFSRNGIWIIFYIPKHYFFYKRKFNFLSLCMYVCIYIYTLDSHISFLYVLLISVRSTHISIYVLILCSRLKTFSMIHIFVYILIFVQGEKYV